MSETHAVRTALAQIGLPHAGRIFANLPVDTLIEETIRRREGRLTDKGALVVNTGKYTGRSPQDRFLCNDPETHDTIDWGAVNQPFLPNHFDRLLGRMQAYLQDRDLFVFDGFAGADAKHRLPIRVVTELAWHNLFARQLLVRPSPDELAAHQPRFTLIDAARFQADPARDCTRSEAFIILDFRRRLGIIGGTEYAGEIKKSIFSVLNYLLPRADVLPMHCSANRAKNGATALFFGLSGTGKTTLSADPERELIGDDEHGWGEDGIFNFEGGCYAKCTGLDERREPQIWSAIRFGAVLENVALDSETGAADYGDGSLTENTRAAYPLEHIAGAVLPSVGSHPSTIVFLTADAFGVLPPISRLTRDQSLYHFLSGYTSKLAGTERGVTEPQATFSACFGAPFMPLPPMRYAELLGRRLDYHRTRCYLVNTGWIGGPYGVGRRIDLETTREIVRAALSGELNGACYDCDAIFGLFVPKTCGGVDPALLRPWRTWADPGRYEAAAEKLARLFIKNFKRFGQEAAPLARYGPG